MKNEGGDGQAELELRAKSKLPLKDELEELQSIRNSKSRFNAVFKLSSNIR